VAFYAFTKQNTIIYHLPKTGVSYYQPYTVHQIIVTLHALDLVKITSHFFDINAITPKLKSKLLAPKVA
jgi:hypothetical protein